MKKFIKILKASWFYLIGFDNGTTRLERSIILLSLEHLGPDVDGDLAFFSMIPGIKKEPFLTFCQCGVVVRIYQNPILYIVFRNLYRRHLGREGGLLGVSVNQYSKAVSIMTYKTWEVL